MDDLGFFKIDMILEELKRNNQIRNVSNMYKCDFFISGSLVLII